MFDTSKTIKVHLQALSFAALCRKIAALLLPVDLQSRENSAQVNIGQNMDSLRKKARAVSRYRWWQKCLTLYEAPQTQNQKSVLLFSFFLFVLWICRIKHWFYLNCRLSFRTQTFNLDIRVSLSSLWIYTLRMNLFIGCQEPVEKWPKML